MKKDSKQRLFEVMQRLDKTFKPKLNENIKESIGDNTWDVEKEYELPENQIRFTIEGSVHSAEGDPSMGNTEMGDWDIEWYDLKEGSYDEEYVDIIKEWMAANAQRIKDDLEQEAINKSMDYGDYSQGQKDEYNNISGAPKLHKLSHGLKEIEMVNAPVKLGEKKLEDMYSIDEIVDMGLQNIGDWDIEYKKSPLFRGEGKNIARASANVKLPNGKYFIIDFENIVEYEGRDWDENFEITITDGTVDTDLAWKNLYDELSSAMEKKVDDALKEALNYHNNNY